MVDQEQYDSDMGDVRGKLRDHASAIQELQAQQRRLHEDQIRLAESIKQQGEDQRERMREMKEDLRAEMQSIDKNGESRHAAMLQVIAENKKDTDTKLIALGQSVPVWVTGMIGVGAAATFLVLGWLLAHFYH